MSPKTLLDLAGAVFAAATVSDQEILARLFQDCRGDLFRLLKRRLRDEQTALDLTQEAFLRLARGGGLHAIADVKAYLFRTAQNLVIDRHRSRASEASALQELGNFLADTVEGCTAEQHAMASEEMGLFVAAFEELPPRCREIFHLNRFGGLTHREISERLGIPLRTVEANVKRAVRHCAARLNRL